ncbi:hypothetical protein BDY21DRAFT_359854 [Lineolata rhizophorae]|uniref:Uncharacterized protein n=1 Tax=Lineolata rhizophorae TaxID=578093 RepID=A0A6A6PD55_9PEZI|nr:hypothetical protein BDY21DRAFT_359854 [Lineolata rhizophorae]
MRFRPRSYRASHSWDYNTEQDVVWYWRFIALLASWMILGGYLIFPATYDTDPRLRFSRAVLSVFIVVLLVAGYAFTALLVFALPRHLAFHTESVFLPALTSSALGLLTVFYAFASSTRFDWTTGAVLQTALAAFSTLVYAVLLLFTQRRRARKLAHARASYEAVLASQTGGAGSVSVPLSATSPRSSAHLLGFYPPRQSGSGARGGGDCTPTGPTSPVPWHSATSLGSSGAAERGPLSLSRESSLYNNPNNTSASSGGGGGGVGSRLLRWSNTNSGGPSRSHSYRHSTGAIASSASGGATTPTRSTSTLGAASSAATDEPSSSLADPRRAAAHRAWLANQHPASLHTPAHAPPPLTDEERINAQMASLLRNGARDCGPSPDAGSSTFRIEWPGAGDSEGEGEDEGETDEERAARRRKFAAAGETRERGRSRGLAVEGMEEERARRVREASREERRREIEMGLRR